MALQSHHKGGDSRQPEMMLWLVALAVAEPLSCVRSSTDNSHHCALCDDTPGPLLGNDPQASSTITYHVGGQFAAGMRACLNTTDAFARDVHEGAIITQEHTSNYVLRGSLKVIGPRVQIFNVRVQKAIELSGDNVSFTTVREITVLEDDVGVRIYKPSATGPMVNASNIVISDVTGASVAVAAIAYVFDEPMTVTCSPDQLLVTQPSEVLTQLETPQCIVMDLSELMGVLGTSYEIAFFNYAHHTTNATLEFLLRLGAGVNLVVAFILCTCHRSDVSALRKEKQE